jgi:hypothetical protein
MVLRRLVGLAIFLVLQDDIAACSTAYTCSSRDRPTWLGEEEALTEVVHYGLVLCERMEKRDCASGQVKAPSFQTVFRSSEMRSETKRLNQPNGPRRGHETVCDERSHANKQNKGREFDSIVKAKQRNCFTTTSWRGKHFGFNTD